MSNYQKLFEPFKVGSISCNNRFVLSPLTRARSGLKRIPNDANLLYYKMRAEGGFGLLFTEATTISEMANGWSDSPGIYTKEMCDAWKPVVKAVHDAGGKIICQLWFIGRASHSSFMPGKGQIVSASNIPRTPEDMVHTAEGEKVAPEVPRPLTVEEIATVVKDYGKAAAYAKEAGFDGVELHCANGYLLDQFLQSCSNDRTDQYGGSVENRFRIVKEALQEIFKVYTPDRVGVRISPNGLFNSMGSEDNNEIFTYAATEFDKLGLGFMDIMDGLAFGYHNKCPVQDLAHFRKLFKGTIIGNCGYTADTAEERIAEGLADGIAFGRITLSNPDFPNRLKNGWPIAEMADFGDWYASTPDIRENPHKGYTHDYPAYREK